MARQRHSFRRAIDTGLWGLGAGLAAVAALRWAGTPPSPVAIGVQGMTPWLLVPSFPLALVAGGRRRPALAAVALALGAAQIAAIAPELGPLRPVTVPDDAARIRLVTANILLDNPDPEGLAAEITSLGPDVVLLQEVTPWGLLALRSTGLLERFPHHVLDAREGGHGSAILSRIPLRDGRAISVAEWPMTRADITTATGPVRLVNVHAAAPLSGPGIRVWRRQLEELARIAPPPGGRLVLAGDFNATSQHPPFRDLVRQGLRDGHDVAGRGLAPTWPSGRRWLPPLLRLDHVLVGDGVTVVSVRRTRGTGSDHRFLSADLAFPARG
ncbi:MAG: hypothetical protein QG622_912 [Actinomycetota bacterium]|nr:hypothetical protein [Actinomycetota bacterium]